LLLFFKKEVISCYSLVGDVMTLKLDHANTIALATIAAAKDENITGMTVVVTDAGGHVRVAMRADEAGFFGFEIALAKATTALGFGTSSAQIARMLGGNQAAVAGLVGATGGRFLPLGGGILIADGAGTVLGAVAAAGSTPENDERLAAAGVAAAGLIVQP